MYIDYLNNESIRSLSSKLNHIESNYSPDIIKNFFQDEVDIINKLIPIKQKIQKSEEEKAKKEGGLLVDDGEKIAELENKLDKLSTDKLNKMLDDLKYLVKNAPFEMYPNERTMINIIDNLIMGRD